MSTEHDVQISLDENGTREYIKELISHLYQVSGEVTDETELVASGIIDSFGIVRITHKIEEEFKIKIPNEGLTPQNFCSIVAISDFILRLKNKGAS